MPRAYATAFVTAVDCSVPPSDMLITFAPWSAAQTMPSAVSESYPLPFASSTRTGRIVTSGATPETPAPLPVSAPIVPATCVPCPCGSVFPPARSATASYPVST